jgi:hypothetical protein
VGRHGLCVYNDCGSVHRSVQCTWCVWKQEGSRGCLLTPYVRAYCTKLVVAASVCPSMIADDPPSACTYVVLLHTYTTLPPLLKRPNQLININRAMYDVAAIVFFLYTDQRYSVWCTVLSC